MQKNLLLMTYAVHSVGWTSKEMYILILLGSTFFKQFTFHFQIWNWYMKCLCDKKELMPLHKIKHEG
jgi:hypothetical protein